MRHCANSAILARRATASRALAPLKEQIPVASNSDDSAVIHGSGSGSGYSKAINHLAVNFLAVVVVVGLVVLGANLPIAEQSKRQVLLDPSPAKTAPEVTPAITLAELQDELLIAQANFKATQARLAETQRRVQSTAAVQSPSFRLASAESEALAAPPESTCGKTPLLAPSMPPSGSICPSDKPVAP